MVIPDFVMTDDINILYPHLAFYGHIYARSINQSINVTNSLKITVLYLANLGIASIVSTGANYY